MAQLLSFEAKHMITDKVKVIAKEKRSMSLGELIELIMSGSLRIEAGMDKHAFAQLIGITRKTLREIEGLEKTPKLEYVFNAAVAFGIKLTLPRGKDEQHSDRLH